tara:strand:- start:35893 stop:36846 length:954 start_codon:yes stop_codon:yes gene_type:complete
MGHFIQPKTICNSGPPLDCIDVPTPAHGYGFDRLRAGYTGYATKDNFDNGNGEVDIGFGGSSPPDDYDIESWENQCSGGEATLRTWYDQFGSADMIQSVASIQPMSSDGMSQGTHDMWAGGQLAISFDGVGDYMRTISTSLGQYENADCTMFALGGTASGVNYDMLMSVHIGIWPHMGTAFAHSGATTAHAPTFERQQGGWQSLLGTTANEGVYGSLATRYSHGAAVDMDMRLNDTAQGTKAVSANTNAGTRDTHIGRSGSSYGKPRIQMLLFWTERLTDAHLSELERLKTWIAGGTIAGGAGEGGEGEGEGEGGGP